MHYLAPILSTINKDVKREKSYLLAEVERWDMGLVKVMRHSMSSPARNTGPRAIEATTSIICSIRKQQQSYRVNIWSLICKTTRAGVQNAPCVYSSRTAHKLCINILLPLTIQASQSADRTQLRWCCLLVFKRLPWLSNAISTTPVPWRISAPLNWQNNKTAGCLSRRTRHSFSS